MRSFVKLQSIDPGFRAAGVLVAGVSLPAARYDPPHASQFFDDTLARLSALPGVHAAAGTLCPPLAGPCIGTSYSRTDRPEPVSGQAASAQIRPVTPAFFETMGIARVAGRDFAASDTAQSLPVAIVSAWLVKQHFEQEDPIGHSLRVNVGQTPEAYTIVGVVGDIKLLSLDEAARPAIYLAAAQLPGQTMRFVLRTSQDPMSLANSVRAAVQAKEPEAPVIIRPLDEIVGSTIARPRAISMLVGVFALVALVLAAVGVYGVMAYSVRERTQEIGVRMALGASAASVFRLVLGQALRLVVIGVVAGLIAAGALAQLLKRLLYEIEPLDPWTFAGTAVLLLAVATIASYVPARRGMQMAPVDALRTK
jgi:putative ABC transport system permease protein